MALSHPQFGLGAGAHQEVLFCAAIMRATLVVLARRSEVGRRREIADSKCADIRRRSQSLWSPGASFGPEKSLRRPCWSRKLHAPGTAHVGVWITRPPGRSLGMAWTIIGVQLESWRHECIG